jgi:DNA-binding response OmpR family regulator
MQTADQSILIIEHDDPTRELYTRELNRSYRVLDCPNQRDVLDLVQSHAVDAIILEPYWPDGQGWCLLSAIQAANPKRAIPVIVCSTLDERTRGVELGVSAYLVKPVLPRTLSATLHRLLDSQGPT